MTELKWKTDSNTINNDCDKNLVNWMVVMEEAYQRWLRDLEAGDPEAANFK